MGEILYHSSSFILDLINLILTGKEDMHESLDELKFRPDTTTNTRVICPCTSEKLMYNVVSTLGPSFWIGSSSYLQVMRTSITSRTSSKFGQIGPRTAVTSNLRRSSRSCVRTFEPADASSIPSYQLASEPKAQMNYKWESLVNKMPSPL